jgi:hypothetical protein
MICALIAILPHSLMTKTASRDARPGLMRQRIAAQAARLMAEDGIDDFSLAKRKAARQLGAPATQALPGNEEIETELKSYRDLYQRDQHRAILTELRRKALDAMRFFRKFEPYLAGAVLKGSAGEYSAVNVQLFAANEKELELFLLNHPMRFSIEEEADFRSGQHARVPVYCLEWDGSPLRLALYEPVALRGALKPHPLTGLAERASIVALERLLAAAEQPATEA